MAVVLVAWLAFTFLMVQLLQWRGDHRNKTRRIAFSNVGNLNIALSRFQADCGRCPTAAEGLAALVERPPTIPPSLWRGPYLIPAKIPADPWDRAYIYKCPGTHNTNGFDVSSGGPSGRPGTPEEIGNWRFPFVDTYWTPIVKTDLARCAIALRALQADCGRYPTTEEGLGALIERPPAIPATQWHGPYVVSWWKTIPFDPWHRRYIYKCPGLHNTNGFDISSSAGMDDPGTSEIGNW